MVDDKGDVFDYLPTGYLGSTPLYYKGHAMPEHDHEDGKEDIYLLADCWCRRLGTSLCTQVPDDVKAGDNGIVLDCLPDDCWCICLDFAKMTSSPEFIKECGKESVWAAYPFTASHVYFGA